MLCGSLNASCLHVDVFNRYTLLSRLQLFSKSPSHKVGLRYYTKKNGPQKCPAHDIVYNLCCAFLWGVVSIPDGLSCI